MKPLFLKEILNYEYPVSALNALTSQDCTADGFDADDLSRDFFYWRSNTKDQIDIYFEISEADQLNTFALIGTNLSDKAQVYISASLTSGIASFYSPLFTKSLIKKNNDWIFYSNTLLPSAQYFKMTIVENGNDEIDYVEIARVICGISKEFSLAVVDGFTNGNDSYQKRETIKGQWRPGSEDSILKRLDLEFQPAFGNRLVANNDFDKIYEMDNFLEDVKTSKPFLFILNPKIPEQFFGYFVVDGDAIEKRFEGQGEVYYAFSLRELK